METPQVEYLFGPFRMDVASLQLWKDSQLISLTPKAFDTLLVLVQHHNRVVRKDELLSAVWPNTFVSEDNLAQNITLLRKCLGDDHNQPQYIATLPRRGYRFIAPVSVKPDPAAVEIAPPPVHVDPPQIVGPLASEAKATARLRIAVAALVVAAIGAGAYVAGRASLPAIEANPLSFALDAPTGTHLASGAVLSPDGRSVALIAQDQSTGSVKIWVRALDHGTARMVEGTEGASRPFWSPDGQSLGFFANGRLKRISLSGGSAQTLASFVGLTSSGGSWSSSDIILFAAYKTGIWAVPAAGGKPTPVTTVDAAHLETAHRWPQFLPDGQHFLFTVAAEEPERSGVFLGSLDSQDRKRLLDDISAVFAPPGFLFFIRDRVLLAQPFDASTHMLSGKPVPMATGVAPPGSNNNSVVSAVPDLLTFGATSELRLAWFDRSGKSLQDVKSPIGLSNMSLSRDQTHVIAGNGTDVWLIDLERDAPTRLTPGNTPMQSPDGSEIAFTSARKSGISDIFIRPTAGAVTDELVIRSAENKFMNDWTKDGRYLVYGSLNPQTKMDLWLAQRQGETTPVPFLTSPFNEFQAQVSPDGRWIAYASDESGIWEVYVQSFPTPGAKRAVSSGGGSEPQWRGDGKELFYLGADGTLMSVDVEAGASLQVSRRRALFRTPIPISGEMYARRNHYIPSVDGQRFLMNTPEHPQGSITMVVNWRARVAN